MSSQKIYTSIENEPARWLALPLKKRPDPAAPYIVSAGWQFVEPFKTVTGIAAHCAVDFAGQYGMPIFAAADGLAVHTYHYKLAKQLHQGKVVAIGLGHLVQILHPNGWCTAYANLAAVACSIPYLPPAAQESAHHPGFIERDPVLIYVAPALLTQAAPVKQGDLIGLMGNSAMGWGVQEDDRLQSCDDVANAWGPPVLHFEVYVRDEHGQKQIRLDPFDICGEAQEYVNGALGEKHLWLLDSENRPLHAA